MSTRESVLNQVRSRPILRTFARRVDNRLQRVLNSKYQSLKKDTDGLLRAVVYKEITKAAKRTPEGTFLEIGGASGSASIALAWGLKGKLVVVEKCEGGSRALYGGYDENKSIIENNFRRYEIRPILFADYLTDQTAPKILDILEHDRLIGMMCDADGRLDRDFAWFFNRLTDKALIIIDDYPTDETTAHPKKRLTWYLVNKLKEWGLFIEDKRVFDTVFGHKGDSSNWKNFNRGELQEIVKWNGEVVAK